MPHWGPSGWIKPPTIYKETSSDAATGGQFWALGQWKTNYVNWEEAVNNIKTSVMPPLHYVALSRSSLKNTLGCSNLRGSSLMSGHLHCSFAPAHLYQMIPSSTSNLLTLIPHPQSTSTLPTSCFSYPSTFCFLSPPPLPSSTQSLCLVRFAWVSSEMGEQKEIGAEPSHRRVCVHVCSIWHLSRSKKTKRSLVWLWRLYVPL